VRWWTPGELDRMAVVGEAMGIGHVEAGPLTRSSYHARQSATAVRDPGRGHRLAHTEMA
jgi:lipoic acid synthetase